MVHFFHLHEKSQKQPPVSHFVSGPGAGADQVLPSVATLFSAP